MANTNIPIIISDTQILEWLEEHHTLHTNVDILYVVDGYEVALTDESDNILAGPYKGETLRLACIQAIQDLGGY